MAFLDVDDRQLYFEHHQANDDQPTVVLIHGFGMACRVWDHTLSALLERGFNVVAYDQRCCGNSDKDFSDVSIEAMATDVQRICESLSLNNIVLNGWSLGGAIAVGAASLMPSAVKGLVLTGGATPRYTQADGFPHGGMPEDVLGTVAALRADRPTFLRGLYYEGVFAKEVPETVKHWCWQIAMQESPAGDQALGALADVDQRDIMAAMNIPALVIHGTADGVVPFGIGQFAADLLPQGELAEMSGCGHAPFLEDTALYHEHLLSFLSRLG